MRRIIVGTSPYRSEHETDFCIGIVMTGELIVDVLMPQMGVATSEAVVTKWLVGNGDAVTNEQVVCEISTDKTDAEILAPAAGVLFEILVPEGSNVAVGAPVARIATGEAATHVLFANGDSALREQPAVSEVKATDFAGEVPVSPTTSAANVTSSIVEETRTDERVTRTPVNQLLAGAMIDPTGAADAVLSRPPRVARPLSSPLARRRAQERGIDLALVQGTGRQGRINVHDVLATVKSAPASSQAAPVLQSPFSSGAAVEFPVGYDDVPHEIVATSAHRRATAEHMIRSRQTSAHMYTEVEVDMSSVARARELINSPRVAAGQPKISYLPFIARAAIEVLAEFPDINSTFQYERSIQWGEVNLGVAVDTPSGLVVPVVRGAERMSLEAIADSIRGIADRARNRRLQSDELRAGTFTISNPGSVGAVAGPAIINQPQVAILGVPVIVKRPWVITTDDGLDAIAIRPIMKLALTYDHRAVDGAYATRYVVKVKDLLESWEIRDYLSH
jgi:pyruvate/2-oxoglutarate dehydrogenase complex dihydrolipoamide acyltransferase (E2) component